jgi:tRNA (cmo5U34)-methyltransferase
VGLSTGCPERALAKTPSSGENRAPVPQYHDAPGQYLSAMRTALPLYDRVQDEVAAAARDVPVRRLLDLGIGTGETTRRVLAGRAGDVAVVGVDRGEAMLEIARGGLPGARLVRQGIEDPLPGGPFDLVVAAFAVHHLRAEGKRALFAAVHDALVPGGRFVLADVVVAGVPVGRPAPLDPAADHPDALRDQLEWLAAAGLDARATWAEGDLAVVAADRPAGGR